MPHREQTHEAGERIISRGERVEHLYLMISGWAARVRYTPEGTRQIIHVLLPGDLVTDDIFVVRRMDHDFVSLTKVVVRMIEPGDLQSLLRTAPSLLSGLCWVGEQEDGMLREQIVRLGRRSALHRTCHLLLEFHRRLPMVKQATEESFVLPISQIEMSDLLGLSVVHLNRTLKKLDNAGFIERRRSLIRLLNRDALAKLCDFNVGHLHLDSGISQSAIG